MKVEQLFTKENVISTYTSQEAEADGGLISINKLFPKRKNLISYVTPGLMELGYLKEDGKPNWPNLVDLLDQCLMIVKRASRHASSMDWMFSGAIELPSGDKQKVFICQNEEGEMSYTAMLPGEY